MKASIIAAAGALAALIALMMSGRAPDVKLESELRGKVVLVSFWATYCASCVHEMPKLVETHKKFATRGFDTLAVAVHQDDPARVAQFAKALPFNVTFDSSGELARQFGERLPRHVHTQLLHHRVAAARVRHRRPGLALQTHPSVAVLLPGAVLLCIVTALLVALGAAACGSRCSRSASAPSCSGSTTA